MINFTSTLFKRKVHIYIVLTQICAVVFDNSFSTRQARNLTTNVPKILDLKSSSEQIFSEN